jgi:ABC-type polysaccharide/polyol phosphate transport system ATPase subunit
MTSITLENVVTEFPIYGMQRHLRRNIYSRLFGKDGGHSRRVVVRALNNICMTLRDGDRLGIMGHNGAGKTTILRVFAGIYTPTHGRIDIQGRVSTLLHTAPGLDLDDTGYENIYTCGLYLGMSSEEIAAKMKDIEEFVELGDYLALPVRTYSAGMMVRLGFAVATAIDPEILVLDEGLSAGDARFTERAGRRIQQLVRRTNILILASHSEQLIREMCNRAILLNHGNLVADGSPDKIIAHYHELLKQPQPPTLTAEVIPMIT